MTFKEHARMHMKERWEKRKENNKWIEYAYAAD
jgi:hypothetical protein